MNVLKTLLKVTLALVLVVPVTIILLATVLGIFGALFGLALFALRLAIIGLVAYGAFRLFAWMFGGRARRAEVRPVAPAALPPVDPYYQAAMRELDSELGPMRQG